MIDLKEFRERNLKPVNKDNLRQFLQAEVEVSKLTNDIGWDYFLSIVQGILNQAVEAKEINREKMDSEVFDHVELLTLKSAITRCDERIKTLNMILALPKEIKERGRRAKVLIDDSPIEKSVGRNW